MNQTSAILIANRLWSCRMFGCKRLKADLNTTGRGNVDVVSCRVIGTSFEWTSQPSCSLEPHTDFEVDHSVKLITRALPKSAVLDILRHMVAMESHAGFIVPQRATMCECSTACSKRAPSRSPCRCRSVIASHESLFVVTSFQLRYIRNIASRMPAVSEPQQLQQLVPKAACLIFPSAVIDIKSSKVDIDGTYIESQMQFLVACSAGRADMLGFVEGLSVNMELASGSPILRSCSSALKVTQYRSPHAMNMVSRCSCDSAGTIRESVPQRRIHHRS
jgi:hypothetical protein